MGGLPAPKSLELVTSHAYVPSDSHLFSSRLFSSLLVSSLVSLSPNLFYFFPLVRCWKQITNPTHCHVGGGWKWLWGGEISGGNKAAIFGGKL